VIGKYLFIFFVLLNSCFFPCRDGPDQPPSYFHSGGGGGGFHPNFPPNAPPTADQSNK
jgi:hypothetical protein